MKARTIINMITLLGAGALLLNTGCSTCRDVRSAKDVAVVDALPSAADKGQVEFYTLSSNFPVPVYFIDDRGKPILLGSVGLKKDDKYSTERNGEVAANKLRISLPAGTHQFMIEQYGPRLRVPVTAGQVTPVELDYVLLDTGVQYVVYRLDSRVFSARSAQESGPKAGANTPEALVSR